MPKPDFLRQVVRQDVWDRYLAHEQRWKACKACPLHKDRKRACLFRGHLPAEVLLIGEGPGKSEDAYGLPFVGEAGRLLDAILSEAIGESRSFRYAITNLVACIPFDNYGDPRAPLKSEVVPCSPRLQEFIALCSPRLLVRVGKPAERFCPPFKPSVSIVHPASILRASGHGGTPKAAIDYRRSVLTIAEAIRELDSNR